MLQCRRVGWLLAGVFTWSATWDWLLTLPSLSFPIWNVCVCWGVWEVETTIPPTSKVIRIKERKKTANFYFYLFCLWHVRLWTGTFMERLRTLFISLPTLSSVVQLLLSLIPFSIFPPSLYQAFLSSVTQSLALQSLLRRPAPLASPGSLLEMQTLWPCRRSTELDAAFWQGPQATPVHGKVIGVAQ